MTYTTDEKLNAMYAVLTAKNPNEQKKANENLHKIMGGNNMPSSDPEEIVREILLDLGTVDRNRGHLYIVDAVLVCMENRSYINNITSDLYPIVAAHFGSTASRVERAIRHSIERTFERGDYDVIKKYFGNTIDPNRGKATNGEFIARITSITRQRMKNAAPGA